MRAQLTKNALDRPGRARRAASTSSDRPPDPSELREEVAAPVRRLRARRCSTSPTTSSTARSSTRRTSRVLDGDDTYLVVAADKGTATFSDTANARRRGATASGSATRSPPAARAGYDHKKLGITARGAWESVKRHFRELELDVGDGPVHGRRDRRHVGRRVRQRDAAVRPHPAGRRLRPPPHLHRPRPGPGRRLRGAQAAVRRSPARRGTTTTARRSPRAAASGRAPPSGSRCREAAQRALGIEDDALRAQRPDPRDPARAGRPAVERRHRHRRQGARRDRRRPPRTARATRSASTRASCAAASWGRAATSG